MTANPKEAHRNLTAELFDAVAREDEVRIRALLAEGADPDGRHGVQTMLHWAANFGAARCVSILLEAGADMDIADDDGLSPFSRAVRSGAEEVAKILLAAGADIRIGSARPDALFVRRVRPDPDLLRQRDERPSIRQSRGNLGDEGGTKAPCLHGPRVGSVPKAGSLSRA